MAPALSKMTIASFSFILAMILLVTSQLVASCGFEDDALQKGIAADLAKPLTVINVPSNKRATGFSNIRIRVFTSDLYDSSKFCTAAGEVKPDFKGGTLTCTAEDVFTVAKRNQLENEVLPYAMDQLKNALQVVPLSGNLVVGSTSQCSGGFTIDPSHTTTGVPNVDYVLYVAAGPTVSGNIAWAGGCQSTSGSPSRIIVGRANFGPKYLVSSTFPLRDVLVTGVHELLHALGYSYSSFTAAGIVSTITVRGISKSFVTSTEAKNKAREYIGCGSVPGIELENEGGSGSAQSHPDRRVYKDDIMAATSGAVLSTTTLAVMEGLQVYKANFSAAENMITGKGLGCAYVEKDCTDPDAPGQGDIWCTGTAVGCTSNLDGVGPCTSSPSFTDGCKYVVAYSNSKCYDTTQTDNADTGDTYHDTKARCFNTQNTFRKTGSSVVPGSTYRCLKTQCFSKVLSIGVGRDTTSYAICTLDDSTPKTISGFDGEVICGNITRMCDSLQKYANATDSIEPLNAANDVPLGKDNRATDWLYTTKLQLTITGKGWAVIIKEFYSDMFRAMQLDVAQHLGIQQQQVWVNGVTANTNTVQFFININAPDVSSSAIQSKFQPVLGGRAWMPRLATLYAGNAQQSDVPVLGGASSNDKPSNPCTPYIPSFEDSNTCNGFIAGLVIAGVLLLAAIFFTVRNCCCRPEEPPGTAAPKSQKYEATLPRRR